MGVFDKYECDGQISLFDIIEPPKVNKLEVYLEEAILHGTGFAGGKKRVEELYQKNMTPSERTSAIKKEYGLGGCGWPLDGYGLYGYNTFSDGLEIEWKDEDGKHEQTFGWKHVETVIHKLVSQGKYISS